MYGIAVVCLFLVSTVSAQVGGYVDRGAGGSGLVEGRVRRPGGIIGGGIIDPTIGGIIEPRIGGGILDPTIGVIGGDCYRNEVPSFRPNGRIDRCSFRRLQDPRCLDPRARCRNTQGRRGTCCVPRRHNLQNRCLNGLPGQGSCYSDIECRQQFGRGYNCQFGRQVRRGNYGTCCSRFGQGGIRY